MMTINECISSIKEKHPDKMDIILVNFHAWLITKRANGKGNCFVTMERHKNLIIKYKL